jgi:hypothetical protein
MKDSLPKCLCTSQFLSFFFCIFFGCTSPYLHVKQEAISKKNHASNFASTPYLEPLLLGDSIIIHWYLPKKELLNKPVLCLEVLYKDLTVKKVSLPMEKPLGTFTFSLIGEAFAKKEGIFSYQVKVMKKEELLIEYKQALWTPLIQAKEVPNVW